MKLKPEEITESLQSLAQKGYFGTDRHLKEDPPGWLGRVLGKKTVVKHVQRYWLTEVGEETLRSGNFRINA